MEKPNKILEMLGFVPQPNLRSLRFLPLTEPIALWFLDKSKVATIRIDRAHREFTPEEIEFIANIVRLYRGEAVENTNGSDALLQEKFPEGKYIDVAGLCRVANIDDMEAQDWSLNPSRYVGVAERAVEDFDFVERLEELNEELEVLNTEARELEQRIAESFRFLLKQS